MIGLNVNCFYVSQRVDSRHAVDILTSFIRSIIVWAEGIKVRFRIRRGILAEEVPPSEDTSG